MNADESANLQLARGYLAALERGADAAAIGAFLHPEVVIQIMPNRLAPAGQRSDRAAILAEVERGRKLMQSQRYDVVSALAAGDRVALEIAWTGTLAAAFGPQYPAGSTLRARLGVFLEFRDGRIIAQRNYDCYETA